MKPEMTRQLRTKGSLDFYAEVGNQFEKEAVAMNKNTSNETLNLLYKDPSIFVRLAVLCNPNFLKEEVEITIEDIKENVNVKKIFKTIEWASERLKTEAEAEAEYIDRLKSIIEDSKEDLKEELYLEKGIRKGTIKRDHREIFEDIFSEYLYSENANEETIMAIIYFLEYQEYNGHYGIHKREIKIKDNINDNEIKKKANILFNLSKRFKINLECDPYIELRHFEAENIQIELKKENILKLIENENISRFILDYKFFMPIKKIVEAIFLEDWRLEFLKKEGICLSNKILKIYINNYQNEEFYINEIAEHILRCSAFLYNTSIERKILKRIVKNQFTSQDMLYRLSKHRDGEVRLAVAKNQRTNQAIIQEMFNGTEGNRMVREAVENRVIF